MAFITRVVAGEGSHTNTLRFFCLLKDIEEFMFSVYRLHHRLKRKQSNKYSFELESLESVSLINARAAACCVSFFSLPNHLREEFHHFKVQLFEIPPALGGLKWERKFGEFYQLAYKSGQLLKGQNFAKMTHQTKKLDLYCEFLSSFHVWDTTAVGRSTCVIVVAGSSQNTV